MLANIIMFVGLLCFIAVFVTMVAACRIFFTLKRKGTMLVIEERPKVKSNSSVQNFFQIDETNELLSRAFGPANVSRKLEMPLHLDVTLEADEAWETEEPTIQLAQSEVRALLHTVATTNHG